MKALGILSISAAALAALTLYDSAPADARGRSMSFSAPRASMARSFSRPSTRTFARPVTRMAKPTTSFRRSVVSDKPRFKMAKVEPKILKKGPTFTQKSALNPGKTALLKKGPTPSLVQKGALNPGKTTLLKKGTTSGFVSQSTLKPAKLNLAKLPMHKAVAGKAHMVGRLAVPKSNFKPKLILAHAPKPGANFKPFIQRHWKKAFFWVAVAGVGYVTVPELYYDRFYRCTSVDDPDYDHCVSILSYAALEEEEIIGRVRTPMPSTASYRYTVATAPTQAAKETCSFEPFVERQWNRAYVWVQVPETGNVTVPEDVYDRFYGKIGGEPPNYPAACKVLVEAAAGDTVATTSLDTSTQG
jgi:hypothetical protein